MNFSRYRCSLFKLFLCFGLPSSSSMATSLNTSSQYQILEQVPGYGNRKNDLILFSNSCSASSANTVVYYFGGDIQDLPEQMKSSRDNRQYQRWNLISTGEILCRRFPHSLIVTIRPNIMKDGTFARFSNFVPQTTEYGDPVRYDTANLVALRHLHALDQQISKTSTDITLVGFSKGCVVLNQFLHELTALQTLNLDHDLSQFVSRIRRFIWLDGGHNNGDHVMIWPTDESLVSTLLRSAIQVEIYVTPFQINSMNPYKQHHTEQYKKFSQLLTSVSNCDHHTINKMFFIDEKPSIEKHFELLTAF